MMSRWCESRRAPPLTLPTEGRRRIRRVEPPKRVPPPWRRKREKPPGFLPKRPPSVSFSFSDIVYLSSLFLYLCILHVSGSKPRPASRRPPKLWGLLEISKTCCIATPPPPSPLLLLSSSLHPSQQAHKLRRHQALPPWKWNLAPLPISLLSASRQRRRAPLNKWLKLRLRMPLVATRRWWKLVLLLKAVPLLPRNPLSSRR